MVILEVYSIVGSMQEFIPEMESIRNERTFDGSATSEKQVATHGWCDLFESNI